jgi:mannose-6-phosphate isomerase-like protein (cupin superfamily)
MQIIKKVDSARHSIAISRELRMTSLELGAGPPPRTNGLAVGIADMTRDPPHNGERHPDGDELIYIISGRVSVVGDSVPDHPCELGPGDMCIVPRGEWHTVHVQEPARLLHITPGPAFEHR